ncbi:PD40 domain-containing protein [candidate division KSB1 bacterium]|nr:PD40 domain-containing protein [candidate division KSB1 bacterium]
MKHFCKLFFIFIVLPSVSCSNSVEPEEAKEDVLILLEKEPIPPLPADGGIVNQTGKIAFIAPSQEALYLFDIETGQTTFVTDHVSRDVRWSPDGEWIAYSATLERIILDWFSGPIFRIKADGSEKRGVTPSANSEFPPAGVTPVWSPDGSYIAYTSGIGFFGCCDGNIYIIDVNTAGGIKLVQVTSTFRDFLLDWSPDGERFLFQSALTLDNNNVLFFEADWYTMKSDGTNKTLFASDNRKVNHYGFRYSPDGNQLAFIGGSEKNEIYIMDTDGSNIKRITDNSINEMQLSWSLDGTSIMYLTADSRVFIINIDRSGIKQLDISMEIGVSFDWRPKE